MLHARLKPEELTQHNKMHFGMILKGEFSRPSWERTQGILSVPECIPIQGGGVLSRMFLDDFLSSTARKFPFHSARFGFLYNILTL